MRMASYKKTWEEKIIETIIDGAKALAISGVIVFGGLLPLIIWLVHGWR